eukprot:8621655-Karenia_brevis.AAC.1
MTLRDPGVTAQLCDVKESQHQTVNLMGFGPEGWKVPDHAMQDYIAQNGGKPFSFDPESDLVFGYDPKDDRLDMNTLCSRMHDFVDSEPLDDMIKA